MINGKENNKEAYLAINCILPELIEVVERFLDYHEGESLEDSITYYDIIAEACIHLKKRNNGGLSENAELLIDRMYPVYDEMWDKLKNKRLI
jgi:hypothetical protein